MKRLLLLGPYVNHISRFSVHPLTCLPVSIWREIPKCSNVPCRSQFNFRRLSWPINFD